MPAVHWYASMMNTDQTAIARQRLLATLAMMLEAVYDPSAVQVLSGLKPADMRSGGARVPGTSYELPAATAAQVMQRLLAQAGGRADDLLVALAEADVVARLASLTGKTPPDLASLYTHCGAASVTGSDSLNAAMTKLYAIAEKVFTLTHMRHINQLFHQWSADPTRIDHMPVQAFVARFIRNMPP
jgi:hypothetical protein